MFTPIFFLAMSILAFGQQHPLLTIPTIFELPIIFGLKYYLALCYHAVASLSQVVNELPFTRMPIYHFIDFFPDSS